MHLPIHISVLSEATERAPIPAASETVRRRLNPSFVAKTAVLTTALWSCLPTYAHADMGTRSEPVAEDAEVDPDYEKAARLRKDAEDRFFEEDFDGAIANFEAAYELSPHPTDLFNMGRIHEEKGELELALRRYEQFVAQPKVSLEERSVAADRIKVLRVLVQEEQDAKRAADEPRSEVVVTESRTQNDGELRKEGRPMVISGITLLSVGAALAAAGGLGFGLAARRQSDRVADLDTGRNPERLSLSEAEDIQARGKDLETFQIVSVAVGAGVVLAGAGLLAAGLVQRRKHRLEAFSPSFGPGFVGASTGWRF